MSSTPPKTNPNSGLLNTSPERKSLIHSTQPPTPSKKMIPKSRSPISLTPNVLRVEINPIIESGSMWGSLLKQVPGYHRTPSISAFEPEIMSKLKNNADEDVTPQELSPTPQEIEPIVQVLSPIPNPTPKKDYRPRGTWICSLKSDDQINIEIDRLAKYQVCRHEGLVEMGFVLKKKETGKAIREWIERWIGPKGVITALRSGRWYDIETKHQNCSQVQQEVFQNRTYKKRGRS